jgi:muramoyltetrapeptide carboxypeptidase
VTDLRRPPPLGAAGRIHVVAPSGPAAPERLDLGLRVLRRTSGCELHVPAAVSARDGYFAGSDEVRLAALAAALTDDASQVIFAARGGYGATRLLPRLDPEPLRRAPKLLVGFSDVTTLLCFALTQGRCTALHGPVVTQLGTLVPEDIARLVELLRGEVPPPLQADDGACLHGGTAEGPLLVANLEVLRSLVGTRWLPDLSGWIVALEEVGERPYRIDRALTQLLQAGAFRGVRGFAIGQLTGCAESNPDIGGSSAAEVVQERLEGLGVPVVTGFPFGHDPARNAALPCGTLARLDANAATLELLEPLTA